MKRLVRRIRAWFEARRAERFYFGAVKRACARHEETGKDVFMALSKDGSIVISDVIPEAEAKGVGRRKRNKAFRLALEGCLFYIVGGEQMPSEMIRTRLTWYKIHWLAERGLALNG